MPTAVVFGATGAQGGPVARALVDAGAQVRAITRSRDRAADLEARGARPVEADLTDPQSVTAAAKGADLAFFHVPMGVAGPDGARVEQEALEAIAAAEVGHLVYNVGFALPDAPVGDPMLDGRIAHVDGLVASGATVLVPTGYMENFSAAWSAPRIAAGELLYPRPADDPVAWLTNDDVGQATVAALDRGDAVKGRRYRLAGPETLTFTEVAERLSRALGRDVVFRSIPADEYGRMVGAVLGPQAGAGVAAAYGAMPPGPNPLMDPDTAPAREELGLRFTPLEEWARHRQWPT